MDAIVLSLLSASGFGSAAIFARVGMQGMSPLSSTLLSVIVSFCPTVFLAIIFAFSDIKTDHMQIAAIIANIGTDPEYGINLLQDWETINLTANGEMGKMTAAIKEENIVEYAIEEDTTVDLIISIKFIQTMCGFSKISDVAYLHCSNNRPVKLHYSLDDEDSADSANYVRFFVAPKIDD